MLVYERHVHLNLIMKALISVGLWPLKIENSPKLTFCYKIYGLMIQSSYLFFFARQTLQFMILLCINDSFAELIRCGYILKCLLITLNRTLILEFSNLKTLISEIYEKEQKILKIDDLSPIYRKYAARAYKCAFIIILFGANSAIPLGILPFLEAKLVPELYPKDNITGKIPYRTFVAEWMPFDTREHYLACCIWQAWDILVATLFVVNNDALIYGLIIYPSGQLRILQHLLKNFKSTVRRVQKSSGFEDYKQASRETAKACILYHKEIINYVERLNSSISWSVLVDFVLSSVQMAIIVYQSIMFGISFLSLMQMQFFLGMVSEIFMCYWNANEITLEGFNVARAVYDNEWYAESVEVQKLLQNMMLRAQKPLTLKVGPFLPMSNQVALGIMKTTYSYSMLIFQSFNQQ